MEFRNILISTDVSKVMSKVYEHVIYLVKLLDKEMHIVNVLNVLGFVSVPIDRNLDRIIKTMLIQLDKITRNVKRLFISRGVDKSKVGVTAYQGRPVDEIYVYACTYYFDFMIFGLRVITRLDRLLTGSVADKTVRRGKVSVVVRGERC